jgi:hypothetical protein
MEDSHAFANSLTWGPDGWLYGAHGSTVTAKIRGLEFQQSIWRYHPITREFELFAEGGGNTWGLDFDADGKRHCRNELRRADRTAPGSGRVLRERFCEARPTAQSALVRLLRSPSVQRFQRRTRNVRRHRLSRRRVSGTIQRRLHRGESAFERDLLARARNERVEL